MKPVQETGALADIQREILTPAIGIKYDGKLNLKEVINMQDKKQQKLILQQLAFESEPVPSTRLVLFNGQPNSPRAVADLFSLPQSHCTVLDSSPLKT